MGIVYLATQDNPHRGVAVKLISPGAATPSLLKRFEHEAQILGRLQHPGIAQVFEAGTAHCRTASGLTVEQPFLALELVEGLPLTEYAEQRKLNMRTRLKLLAKVCDAVQHAHQKGIIHRDLKPGNILVNESGQPKVLDFGVARLTDSDVQLTTLQTDAGQLIGTLSYMSPEQVSGNLCELDTRSDVYALGVILYRILTGRLPIDLTHKTILEAVRTISEQEPMPLNTLNRAFRGDLTTIVAKALEKDRARRYQSASELAEDIRRFLADQPILARPATTMYQLGKLARRNRPFVAGLLVAVLAIMLGIIGATAQALRATAARDRAWAAEQLADKRRIEAENQRAEAENQRAEAQRQAAIAQAVNSFLNEDLLAAVQPERLQGRDVTVRQVLDQAARSIGQRFVDAPLVEASIRQTLGDAYHGLGEDALAVLQQEQAVELLLTELGEEHEDTLLAMGRLGLTYRALGRFDKAEAVLLRTVELRRALLGEHGQRTLSAMNHLALVYASQGRYLEEEILLRRVLDLGRTHWGEDNDSVRTAVGNLGHCYQRQGRHADAEPLLLEALAANRRIYGVEHPITLVSMSELARLYSEQNRLAEAEKLCAETLALRRRVLGDEHPKTLASMSMLAVLYKRLERLSEAEQLCQETLAIKRRVLGDDHPDTLVSMNNLGSLYATAGRYSDAEPLFVNCLAARRRVLGDDHRITLSSMRNLAELYALMNRFAEAEPLAIEHYERTALAKGPNHNATHAAIELLTNLYTAASQTDDSAAWHAKLAAWRASTQRPE